MAKSIFEQIKKQNGERFAKAIRGYDNGIFDIPGIVDIVKYAGSEAEPIMDYLESLKEVHIEETGAYQDPLTLLDAAGYDAYYVTNLEEQNRIAPYYASAAELEKLGIASPGANGEALCTFRDPHRFEKYHIINAVRKDVDKIKREDFKGREQREDEYGTSVLSIQVLKEGGFISIKNRYNHTVDNPDNTLGSNPDRIILGLSNSIRHHFGTDFSTQKATLPAGYTFINGQIIRYNYEQNNIYFGSNFYVEDGVIHHLKDHEIMLDSYIFDMKSKKLIYPPNHETAMEPYFTDFEGNKFYTGITTLSADDSHEEDTAFKDAFLKEIEGHKVILKKDKDGQHLFIRKEGEKDPAKDIEILTVKDGAITALNLPSTTETGFGFLRANKKLASFTAPCLKRVDYAFLSGNTELLSLDLPSLEVMDGNCLNNNRKMTTFRLPKVKSIGNYTLGQCTVLSELYAPELEKIGNGFLEDNIGLKTLSLPNLVHMGYNCLSGNCSLSTFSAPKLEFMGQSALCINKELKVLYVPLLKDLPNFFLSMHPDKEKLWAGRTQPPQREGISATLRAADAKKTQTPNPYEHVGADFFDYLLSKMGGNGPK